MMRNEFHYLLTAIIFYTRIPVKVRTTIDDHSIHGSTKYFPFIGILVGALTAGIFWAGYWVLPFSLAILLSMAGSLFITGAFHEDGWADFCDGFGGAFDRDAILTIMKDSRIGTFGSVGLIMILAIKFVALSSIQPSLIALVLLSAHAFSRFLPVVLIATSKYVQKAGQIKAKPVNKGVSVTHVWVAALFSLPLLLLFHWSWSLVIIPASALLLWRFRTYIHQKIGGYTGDVLGSLQQLTELLFYILFLVWQNNLINLFLTWPFI